MILLPDENQPVVYKNEVEPNLKQGAALAFAHGFKRPLQPNRTARRLGRDYGRP